MGKGNNKGQGGGSGGGGSSDDGGYIKGNKRDNELYGSEGDDYIYGDEGNDILWGLGGDDRLVGGNGDDTLYGGAGDDSLHGGEGDDALYGGAGSDVLQGGAGADIMDGGPGPGETGASEGAGDHDVASFVEAGEVYYDEGTGEYVYVGLTIEPYSGSGDYDYQTSAGDLIARVEEIRGTNNDDLMIGSDGDDYYVGARGEDVLFGNAGDDTLYGSLDDDEIHADENGGSGSDTLIFLRYNTDGDPTTDDPWALGDGHDTVHGFDVATDSILFLGNEDFLGTAALDITDAGGGDTLVTYATNSSILLVGVDYATEAASITFGFEEVMV